MDATKDSQLAIDFAKAAGFGAFVSKRSGLRAESCKDMQVLIVCFVGGGRRVFLQGLWLWCCNDMFLVICEGTI